MKTKPPQAVLALIRAQPPNIRQRLRAVPAPCIAGRWTIGEKGTNQTLVSIIHTTEVAEVRFSPSSASGVFVGWSEGRPGIEECFTEYRVADMVLTIEDNTVTRYH
jgi:hypothetical protein